MGLEIQNTGKCLQQDSLHTIKQDTSQSDVQPRESAGEDKLREASNAYGAYGQALVKKSVLAQKPDKVDEFVIKDDLTDEEFNKMLEEIKQDPDFDKVSKTQDWTGNERNIDFNKSNIQLAKYILSKKELFENDNFTNQVGNILNWTRTKKQTDARCSVIDKITDVQKNNSELWNNKNFAAKVGVIIFSTESKENADMAKEILKLPVELWNNKHFTDKVGDIIRYTYPKEQADARCSIIDKIIDVQKNNPDLWNNKHFTDNVGSIINNTYTKEQADARCSVIDKITDVQKNNSELWNNKNFATQVGVIILSIASKESADIAKKILKLPVEVWNNKSFADKLGRIIFCTNTQEKADKLNNALNVKTIETVSNSENTCLSNPQKYINGEMSDEQAKSYVESFFNNNYINLLVASEAFDSKTMNVLLRKRIDDAIEYLNTMENFNSDDLKLLKDMSNCTNNDDKPFIESQKIDFINLINAYKKCGLSTDIIKDMTETGKIDLGKINLNLLENIMKKSGFTDEEIQNMSKEKLMSWDMNYMHLLAGELNNNEDNDEEDIQTFKDLIKSANSEDFEKYISDTSNPYGEANQKTKLMYEDMGMNYDKWIHPDKSHNIQFVAKDENLNKLEQVATQVEEDMNTLMNTKAKGFLKKQLGEKFFKDDKFKLPEEYTTSKNKLSEFVEQLADESDKGVLTQMWKRAKGNSKNENPEIKQNAQKTLTVLSHLNQRKEDISNIPKIESKKSLNWTIKMWDRNPQKDIFQGNYSTCCIGMGECNSRAMPHFVMDTAYNMIELTDENGKTTGNALCYFVKDEKGQPAFIIDNIEINNSEKPSNEICAELRNKMAEYASLVAKDVTGRDDVPVYMSSHYNDVPVKDLEKHEEEISFTGDVDSNTGIIYMDLYDGWVVTDNLTQNVELLKLR